MAERTKKIRVFEFAFPDHRPSSSTGFATQEFLVDEEAGDTWELGDEGSLFIKHGSGRHIIVPPGWIWGEMYERVVKVKD